MRTRPLMLAGCLLAGCAAGEGEKQTFVTTVTDEAEESGTTDTTSDGETGTESGDSESDSESESASDSTDAESSETETDESESETGTPDCARRRYTFNLANQTWSSIPLDADWTGPNAPGCDVELLAVEYIEAWSRLIVLGANGMIYRRHDGVWQQPVSTVAILPAVAGKNLTAAIHTPAVDDPSVVTMFLVTDAGEAVIYDITEDDVITLVDVAMTMDNPPPGAPQASQDCTWAFPLADPDLHPAADWLVWWMFYADGFLYQYDAAFVWDQWPAQDNPYFTGGADEPSPTEIEAAYANLELGRVYFIAP